MKRLLASFCLVMLSKGISAAPEAPENKSPALKPFNQEDYRLAFDAFAASGNLERAYHIASKAVASVPNDIEWRHRLARLATWTQRPEEAWAQWEYLFRHGDHSDEVFNALLALAPVADNPELAIEAWESRAAGSTPSPAQWEDLNRLFELTARPQEGSRFFERHYRVNHKPRLLELAAQLAKNGGEYERALQLFLERDRLKPFSPDNTVNAVILMLRRDQLREAYALMESHRPEVPPEAAEYWRILGHTAWQLAEFKAAEQAYRNYAATPNAPPAEWSRLISLLHERNAQQAADLALEAYQRNGGLDFLFYALNGYAESGNTAAQAHVFETLTPAQLREAEGNGRFLVLRAQHYQAQHAPEKAWEDFRHAMKLSPEDSAVVLPALWFIIDNHRTKELLAMLNGLRARAHSDPVYWLPLAAALHTLDRYQEAIFWYRKEIARNPDDLLVLLNFADALEQVQQAGMAERIRRHCFALLRSKFPADDLLSSPGRSPELLALARLTIFNQPGDPSLTMVRKIAQRLRETPPEQSLDPQTADLILSWAITKEQFRNANSWMWLHYARASGSARNVAPMWARSQAALQLNQAETMDKLLSREADSMPIYNRYDTAHELGHASQALDIAFQGLEGNGVDDSLHDRYRQHAPLHANYLQLALMQHKYGTLDTKGQQLQTRFVFNPELRILLGWSQLRHSSNEFNVSLPTVRAERLSSAEVRWTNNPGEMYLAIFRRNGFGRDTGLRLDQGWTVDHRLQLYGGIGYRTDATESNPLRLAGYKSEVHAAIDYAFSKREYLHLAPSFASYYTQGGDYLGRGRMLDAEAGYRIRTEYPDWRVRGFVTRQSFTYDGSVNAATQSRLPSGVQNSIAAGNLDAVRYFIPNGSTTWGACLDMGSGLADPGSRDAYSRAWRPFFSVCKSQNTLNGSGYNSSIGLAGAITGEDHLVLRIGKDRGGPGEGATSNVLDIVYRHYF